jgi:hypothetical protein
MQSFSHFWGASYGAWELHGGVATNTVFGSFKRCYADLAEGTNQQETVKGKLLLCAKDQVGIFRLILVKMNGGRFASVASRHYMFISHVSEAPPQAPIFKSKFSNVKRM